MATHRPPGRTGDRPSGRPATGTLEPFSGYVVPGVCFESGHCFWLLDFETTPTAFESYAELWVIAPDGERVLYVDPEPAAEEVLRYHRFDRVGGASITWERPTREKVAVAVAGDDGVTLDLRLALGRTFGTRLLNAMLAATPRPLLGSRVGAALATYSLNRLLDANGLKVAGRTETGRRYRLDAARLRTVAAADATLDGCDLGERVPPARPIAFGDARTTADALYIRGDLLLERAEP